MDSATGLKPDVSVSIVTFNNERCVADLLSDLDAQVGASWEAIVYDNASADATCERLDRTEIDSLVKGETNLGYSSAHNINIRKCRGRYVLLLNPDVRFAPDTIATLVAHLDRHPGEAMAGPKILEGEHRRHFAPRHFYPGEGMIELEPGINRSEIAWLNGCCILARRDVLERLGGFDEGFFLYQAETDLCLRARRLGYSLGWVPEALVFHLHRQSQRTSSEYEYSRRLFEGSAVFWRKHYTPGDVLQMARFQARSSSALLAVAAPFERLLPPELRRDRLRARRDVCREVAETVNSAENRGDTLAGIVSRQSRLAMQWLRHGRFPLDDY